MRGIVAIPALFGLFVLVMNSPFLGGGGEGKERTAPLDPACVEAFNASGPRLPGNGDSVSVERRDGRCALLVITGPSYEQRGSVWVAADLEWKYGWANAWYGRDGVVHPRHDLR